MAVLLSILRLPLSLNNVGLTSITETYALLDVLAISNLAFLILVFAMTKGFIIKA